MEIKTSIFPIPIAEAPSLFLLTVAFVKRAFWKCLVLRRGKCPPLPPGPTPSPIFGCLIQMLKNKPTFRWIHRVMDEMNTEIACFRLGNVHVISVKSPELAREFLKKQDLIFASRPDCMTAKMASNGYLGAVLTPFGDQWKKTRRILESEVLSPARHRFFHDKRLQEADHLVYYVYNQCRQSATRGVVNVRIAAQQYCANVIKKLVFNQRFFGKGLMDGGPGAEEEEHIGGLFTILNYVYGFSIADYIPCLEVFDFDGHKGILKRAIESVTKYQNPLIEKRIQQWKDGIKKREEDILDILINLRDSRGNHLLTIEEIKAQILEIVTAAVDNPSNAIEWAIAEMINQEDIFAKALKELDSVVGSERLVQESDLSKLNYVKACAREAFRLHPIAPFNLPHVSIEDTTVGGYFIPKGSHVILSRLGLGRNPRIWKDPLIYKPERHISNGSSDIVLVDPELNMLSFSVGRRGCAGVLLGSTMTTVLLARMIHSFTWTKPPGAPSINLTESKDNLYMAEALHAVATPRLSPNVYLELKN